MRKICILYFLLTCGLFAEEAFKPLFNGGNLAGWKAVSTPLSTWKVNKEDGILICNGKPYGELRTERMYQNFILEVEWRHMVPEGNSGIFIWADDITACGFPFHRSVEVQVRDGSPGPIFPIHGAKMRPLTGKNVGKESAWAFPEEDRVKRSPQWNHYKITCMDGAVSLAINGKLVSRGDNATPRKGYICLESEGGIVHFRNMRIKELPDTPLDAGDVAVAERGFVCQYLGVDFGGWRLGDDVSPDASIAEKSGWKAEDWMLVFRAPEKPEAFKPLSKNIPAGNIEFIYDVNFVSVDSQNTQKSSLDVLLGSAKITVNLDSPGLTKVRRARLCWSRVKGSIVDGKLSASLNGLKLVENKPLGEAREITFHPHGYVELANIYVRKLNKKELEK